MFISLKFHVFLLFSQILAEKCLVDVEPKNARGDGDRQSMDTYVDAYRALTTYKLKYDILLK